MTKTSIIMIDDAPMNVGIVQPVIEMSVIPAGSDMPESSLKSKKKTGCLVCQASLYMGLVCYRLWG